MYIALLLVFTIIGCDVSQSSQENEVEESDSSSISLEDKLVVRYMSLESDEKAGDAIVIQTPDSLTLMIDAGRTTVGKQVNQNLNNWDIQTIDIAIATHPHIDHIGGYLTLLDTKEIGKFLMPNVEHTASYYEDLIEKLEQQEVDQSYLEEGDKLSLDNDIEMEVFSPPEGTEPSNSTSIEAINDLSLVIKLRYGETSFLFTGDINMKREKTLIDSYNEQLSADMLHAPHGGSFTSSSLNFIQTIAPRVVVISQNDAEGIEDTNVYERYEDYGSDIFVTGRDGHILLVSDGEEIEVGNLVK